MEFWDMIYYTYARVIGDGIPYLIEFWGIAV